jgi:hypothetical protein
LFLSAGGQIKPLRETFVAIQAMIIYRLLLVLFKVPFFWQYLRPSLKCLSLNRFNFQFPIILSAGNFKVTGGLGGNFWIGGWYGNFNTDRYSELTSLMTYNECDL